MLRKNINDRPLECEVLMAFDSEKDARSFAETFVSQDKEKLLDETRARMNLDNIFSQIQAGDLKELNLIVFVRSCSEVIGLLIRQERKLLS